MKKNFFSGILEFFTAIISLFFVIMPLFGFVIIYFNSPVRDLNNYIFNEDEGIRKREDGAYYIEVRRGETARSVGLRLERAGLIRNRYFWNLIGKLEKEYIKSGTYKVDMPSSQIAIYRLLVSGRQTLHKVTIPEGVTLTKIARILEYEDICSQEDFLQSARDTELMTEYNIPGRSMEGYLFPDTYFFPSNYSSAEVARAMLENFFNKLESIYPEYILLTQRELNEKVILASIIEREYRIPEEAPLMSSVFYNRLNINMGLQSCATVEYIITEIMGLPHPGFITGPDLEIDNRYNTYKWQGLPPGPICAPGIIALKAAFFPEKTDFFYFRLEDVDTGRHIFSRTNEEHNLAGRYIIKPESR